LKKQAFYYKKNKPMSMENMNLSKRIAVIAHDNMKNELIEWSFHNRDVLAQHEIIAAGHTAYILEGTLNIAVNTVVPINLGGYQQIGRMISEGQVDVIIFLWDRNKSEAFDNDIKSLLCLAEQHNIVLALNKQTADALLTSSFLYDHSTKNELLPGIQERAIA
jgi:methylglyoxal synthase